MCKFLNISFKFRLFFIMQTHINLHRSQIKCVLKLLFSKKNIYFLFSNTFLLQSFLSFYFYLNLKKIPKIQPHSLFPLFFNQSSIISAAPLTKHMKSLNIFHILYCPQFWSKLASFFTQINAIAY